MAGQNFAAQVAKFIGGTISYLGLDPAGLLVVSGGGTTSALNVSATGQIKATAGRICKIVVITAGSGGALTINDIATGGTPAAANQVWTGAYNLSGLAAGSVLTLDWPCANGINISAIPTGAVLSVSFA